MDGGAGQPAVLSGDYPDLYVYEPTTNYDGIASYSAPVTNLSPSANTPEIAEYGRMALAGQTIPLTGENMSSNFVVWDGTTNLASVASYVSGQEVAVDVPAGLSDNFYLMWPTNANGYGRAVAVNGAEAMWASHNIVTGETFSVFGQNLKNAKLYIAELDQWVSSSASNPYKADFVMPATANGTYTGYVHNGKGGKYGWSLAVSLPVVSAPQWTNTIINITDAPYNANGSDGNDDYSAITSALAACPYNGTVYFPTGTYYISQPITAVGSNRRILGDGKDISILKPHSTFSGNGPGRGILEGKDGNAISNLEFRDMTLLDDGYGDGMLFYANGDGDENISFIGCKVSQLGSTAVYVQGQGSPSMIDIRDTDYVTLRDSDFYPKFEVRIINSTGSIVKDCNFYGLYDVGRLLETAATRDILITGCLGANYDDSDYTDGTGWGQGRFVYGSGTAGGWRNAYIGQNVSTNLRPRYNFDNPSYPRDGTNQLVNFNTGEHFMFEDRNVYYRGSVTAATSNTVTLDSITGIWVTTQLSVVDGRGYGQVRSVTAINGSVVTVDEPWLVIPDNTTTVSIGKMDYRIVIYDNIMDGAPECYDPTNYVNTAVAGVSFYGGHGKCIVASNTITEVETGLINWSLSKDRAGLSQEIAEPSYFNAMIGNTVDGCVDGFADWCFMNGATVSDVAILASNWRDNTYTNVVDDGYSYGTDETNTTVNMPIWDGTVQ